MEKILRNAFNEAIDILFRISQPCPTTIEDTLYESLAEYKVREIEKSTYVAFQNNKFFIELPPRL
jgi:hypothetical protein